MPFKKNIPQRLVVYPRDVENILGVAPRTGRHIIQKMREALGKKKWQPITVWDFCEYMGLDEDTVRSLMVE